MLEIASSTHRLFRSVSVFLRCRPSAFVSQAEKKKYEDFVAAEKKKYEDYVAAQKKAVEDAIAKEKELSEKLGPYAYGPYGAAGPFGYGYGAQPYGMDTLDTLVPMATVMASLAVSTKCG